MSSTIHPTAIIDRAAQLGADVSIGPYCVIGPNVELGDRCRLHSHVVLDGHTSIGPDCEIFSFAALGHPAQHIHHKQEPARLTIGARNIIREHVTMHTGTEFENLETRIGDDGLFLAGSHVAHDCTVGNHVILANGVGIAGHVELGDFVYMGGYSAVHQFVRIGKHAVVGGVTAVVEDVIPYGSVTAERGQLHGLNIVGLKRRGFSREDIAALRKLYKFLFEGDGQFSDRLQAAQQQGLSGAPADILEFLQADARRPLCLPKISGRGKG